MRFNALARRGVDLTRHSDLLLAGLMVGVVAMMIIPLPTFLLDILITTNISIAVVLLLVSIYVTDALRIAAFPSILLITTLFRLGLNVSSTRLILLQADAGTVIRSFGNFVVAGNLVVGAVIFLILTLIQFIVIAKGSERVAEVAARFTLDAMPGKQMSIDGEVRAGAIEMEEARRLRAALQRESQLYGSMDGAMKFVKGDAIAGILITVVNIVGGLSVGVLQRGMSLSDAGRIYSLLTIGDGLVSQIPALLISTAAGIVVTRVASEDEGSHLGRDIGMQIVAQPRALAVSAGLLALLALVPGLPTVPFLLLSAALGAIALAVKTRLTAPTTSRRHFAAERSDGASPTDALAVPSTITLAVGSELLPFVDAAADGGRMVDELVPGLRELLYAELGVLLPGVHVRAETSMLDPCAYRILLADVPMADGEVDPKSRIAMAGADRLREAGISSCERIEVPGIAPPTCRVPAAAGQALPGMGIQVVDPATQMVLHLGLVLRDHAFELIGIQETQQALDMLERTHPALVHEVVPKLVSVRALAEVLRRLVEEGISIRQLRGILESLAEWAPTEKDPAVLAEYVRMGMRRFITHRYAHDHGVVRAYLLDPMIEDAVRDSVQRTSKGSYLALEPQLSRDIVESVRVHVEQVPPDEPPPVILTTMELRRFVRRLLEVDFAELPVLSFGELLPAVQVQPVARIGIERPPGAARYT